MKKFTIFMLTWVGVFVAFAAVENFLNFDHEAFRVVYYLCSGIAAAALGETLSKRWGDD